MTAWNFLFFLGIEALPFTPGTHVWPRVQGNAAKNWAGPAVRTGSRATRAAVSRAPQPAPAHHGDSRMHKQEDAPALRQADPAWDKYAMETYPADCCCPFGEPETVGYVKDNAVLGK